MNGNKYLSIADTSELYLVTADPPKNLEENA
jgi:hypothetical protein